LNHEWNERNEFPGCWLQARAGKLAVERPAQTRPEEDPGESHKSGSEFPDKQKARTRFFILLPPIPLPQTHSVLSPSFQPSSSAKAEATFRVSHARRKKVAAALAAG
jgi:hypothetical protein